MTDLAWVFYRTSTGSAPVPDFLSELPVPCAAKVQAQMARIVELGLPEALRKERAKKLRHDIWEVRASFNGQMHRVLFAIHGRSLVALHAFEKKSQQTPDRYIRTAVANLSDWQARTPPP